MWINDGRVVGDGSGMRGGLSAHKSSVYLHLLLRFLSEVMFWHSHVFLVLCHVVGRHAVHGLTGFISRCRPMFPFLLLYRICFP